MKTYKIRKGNGGTAYIVKADCEIDATIDLLNSDEENLSSANLDDPIEIDPNSQFQNEEIVYSDRVLRDEMNNLLDQMKKLCLKIANLEHKIASASKIRKVYDKSSNEYRNENF